jgi:uncharacterized protein YfkK (UPF0435 family)
MYSEMEYSKEITERVKDCIEGLELTKTISPGMKQYLLESYKQLERRAIKAEKELQHQLDNSAKKEWKEAIAKSFVEWIAKTKIELQKFHKTTINSDNFFLIREHVKHLNFRILELEEKLKIAENALKENNGVSDVRYEDLTNFYNKLHGFLQEARSLHLKEIIDAEKQRNEALQEASNWKSKFEELKSKDDGDNYRSEFNKYDKRNP